MAFQNSYNNYISRQKKNSTGQFKEKIKNSLGGVAVGNDTTNKTNTSITPNVLGKSTTTNIQKTSNGTPTVNLTTPTITTPSTGSRSVSTPYQMNAHINANPIQPTVLKGQIGGVKANTNVKPNTTPINSTVPVTPAQQTVTTPTTTGTVTSENNGGTGMMSLSDINNALAVEPEDNVDVMVKEITGQEKPTAEFTQADYATINELAKSPVVQSGARATGKTPQQMAQELVEQQKAQLQKDWEQKKAELELQMKQAKESYNQSVSDAESTYKDTDEELKLNRYQQQEDLAVDATRRGIQYSPQQLALENVANINLNKNLADASKKRNELLNNLQIQINQSMENIMMGLQGSTNTYNQSIADIMSDYQKQMMDWAYNDQQTADERAWQEKQTKADQDFQKKMAELQNKWQAEQNALDRKTYGSSKSGGGGWRSYGGSGWKNYSSNWKPWVNYGSYGGARSNWKNYSGAFNNDVDLDSAEGQEATLSTIKQASTNLFNAMNYGSPHELNPKAQLYKEEMEDAKKKVVSGAKGSKSAKQKVLDELDKTYEVALNHLFNESYGRASGRPYKVGDTLKQSKTPYSKEYMNKVNSNRQQDKIAYINQFGLRDKNGKLKSSSRLLASGLMNPEYFDPRNPLRQSSHNAGIQKAKNDRAREQARKRAQQQAKKKQTSWAQAQKEFQKAFKSSSKSSNKKSSKKRIPSAKDYDFFGRKKHSGWRTLSKAEKRRASKVKPVSMRTSLKRIQKKTHKKSVVFKQHKPNPIKRKVVKKHVSRKPKSGIQRAWYNFKKNFLHF